MGALGTLAGGAYSAIGQSQNQEAQAKLAQFNYGQANRAAGAALITGDQDAENQRIKGGKVQGQQATAYAASGVDASSGSPLQVMADTRVMSALDAQRIQNNAARQAYGLKVKAAQIGMQEEADWDSSNNKINSTLLTAGTQAMSQVAGMGAGGGSSSTPSYDPGSYSGGNAGGYAV